MAGCAQSLFIDLYAAHLDTPHFRVGSPQVVRQSVRPGVLGGLHRSEGCLLPRPIAAGAWKHLQFGWGGRLYQSCVLSFGLSPGGFQDQLFPARLLSGPGGAGGLFHHSDVLVSRPVSRCFFPDLGVHFFSPTHVYTYGQEGEGRAGSSGYTDILSPRRCLGPGILIPVLSLRSAGGSPSSDEGGFFFHGEKSSLVLTANFSFLGVLWVSVEGSLALPEVELVRLRSRDSFLLQQFVQT